ncbi:MAG: redoxin domain-containing protein [Dehalococcoidia bacterium]|nr:redoxin domain-containing protein [Dehalococcoidia bacterium]
MMPSRTGSPVHDRLVRYAVVAAIVLVVGGLFVQREFLSGDAAELGMVDGHRPVVGEPAPDFALEDPDGDVRRLSDFRGQTVVLNFWATWCGPCRQEMPEFQALYQEREAAGDLVILAVNEEEPPGHARGFFEEFDLTFPMLLDRQGEVGRHYQLPGLPATYFIDAEGIIRQRTLGPVFGGLLEEGVAAAEAEPASARP